MLSQEAYNNPTAPTIYTFFSLMRKTTKCDISNHKNPQEYGDEFIKARDKTNELGQPVPALPLLRTFLDGLDKSYQTWKKQFLRRDFTKDITDLGITTRKMVVPDVEQIIKELMDRDDNTGRSATTKSDTSRFGAKGPNHQENRQRPESSFAQSQTHFATPATRKCSELLGPPYN